MSSIVRSESYGFEADAMHILQCASRYYCQLWLGYLAEPSEA